MIRHLLFLSIGIFFTSCLSFKPVTTEKVEGFTVNSINSQGVDVTLTLRINNPNSFAIKVKSIDLDVQAGKIALGRVLVSEKVTIPAKSTTSQQFHFTTSFTSATLAALPAALALLTNSEVQIHAEGTVRARAWLITKSFPVNFTDGVKLR